MRKIYCAALLIACTASASRGEGNPRGRPVQAAAEAPPCDAKDKAFQDIMNGLRNTQGLADAAAVIMDVDGPGFIWNTDEKKGDLPKAGSLRAFWKSRNMACYEFVHFAAYFAGHQPLNEAFDLPKDDLAMEERFTARSNAVMEEMIRSMGANAPGVPAAAREKLKSEGWATRPNVVWSLGDAAVAPDGWQSTWAEWDRESEIPRGAVVVGVARLFNNSAGYFHTGISMGRGMIISLRGTDDGSANLKREAVGDLFPRAYYSSVRYGTYPWAKQPRGTYAPRRPLILCPEAEGDTIRAGPRR